MGRVIKTKNIWDSKIPLIICVLLIIFVYFPILIIILFSFNDSTVGIFPLKGFTIKWYIEIIKDPRFISTLKNSLYIATTVTLFGALLGIPAAYAVVRYNFIGKSILQNMLTMPIFIPYIFLGVSLATFFFSLNIKLSLFTVILGHIIISVPFYFVIMKARLTGFNLSIEEASRDLGASSFQTFRRISFPIMWPSILGSALIVFSISMDDFVITFFTIGANSTLPMI